MPATTMLRIPPSCANDPRLAAEFLRERTKVLQGSQTRANCKWQPGPGGQVNLACPDCGHHAALHFGCQECPVCAIQAALNSQD